MTEDTTTEPGSHKSFFTIWIGQLVSILGSGITAFALGIWIFKTYDSVFYYSLNFLFAALPLIAVSPLAGALADKYNRKVLIILADFGAALGTLFIAWRFFVGDVQLWHIYLGVGFSSVCSGLQIPAYKASVSQLVRRNFYAQASGMIQAAGTAPLMISPVIAGALYAPIGLKGILIIDFSTFLVALVMTLLIKIPTLQSIKEEIEPLLTKIKTAFRFLGEQKVLLVMILILGLSNFFMAFLVVLIGPLIMSFTTPFIFGMGQTVCATGFLISSILIGVKGLPRPYVKTLFLSLIILGAAYAFIGFRTNIVLILTSTFLFFLTLPFVRTAIETVIRTTVPLEIQGRVFSILTMILESATLISYLVSGVLADKVFTPFIQGDSSFAVFLRVVIGSGPGRGIGLMFLAAGSVIVIIALLTYTSRKIREFRTEAPAAPVKAEEPGVLSEEL